MSECSQSCPKCGTPVLPGARFCANCGAEVAVPIRAPTPAPPPPGPTAPPATPYPVMPPAAAPAAPAKTFPWVTCIVLGGMGVVLLVVVMVIAVGYMLFLKPRPPAAPPPPMMSMPGPGPMGSMPGGPGAPGTMPGMAPAETGPVNSADEAIARVRARPEVAALFNVPAPPGVAFHVEVDHEDEDSYTVHVYEDVPDIKPGRIESLFWYSVSRATGEVTSIPDPYQ